MDGRSTSKRVTVGGLGRRTVTKKTVHDIMTTVGIQFDFQ